MLGLSVDDELFRLRAKPEARVCQAFLGCHRAFYGGWVLSDRDSVRHDILTPT